MDNIQITEYKSTDRNSCLELLEKTFPGPSTVDRFKWRFEEVPTKHPPLILCAKDKDRVVSFNSWIPWEFTFEGQKYIGYQSGESATCEEYRRKGIFGRVLKYADEIADRRNIDFIFGFPSSMSYTAFYKAGYCPIGTCNYCLKLINPFSKNTVLKSDCSFNDIMTQSLFEKDKITPVFDSDYFDWRYLKSPNHYDVIKYFENNNQAVFVVKRCNYHNKRFGIKVPELFLLDCQFTSYHNVFISNALKHLGQVYSKKAFFIRTFFNRGTDRGRMLDGFFGVRFKSRFEVLIIKLINSNLDRKAFFNIGNWDILPHIIDSV